MRRCRSAAGRLLACPLPGTPLQAGAVQLTWQLPGTAIAVGKHSVLDVQVCPVDAVLRRVDVAMPEHRHCMNYRSSLQSTGGGRWRAEGLMLHMPGRWELRFEVDAGDKHATLRQSITLQ